MSDDSEAKSVRKFHQLYYDQRERTWTNTKWLGVNVLKNPFDLWVYQELIYELKPDLVVECGTWTGGSALYFASMCDLVGCGRVMTIDLEDRGRPSHPRIEYVTGSTVAPTTVSAVRAAARGARCVLVVLDSDHSCQHVLEEMRIYADVVTPGSYLVVEDGNINGHPVLPDFGPGPTEAIKQFLRERRDFAVDESREKFFMTFNPRGYLRRSSGKIVGDAVDAQVVEADADILVGVPCYKDGAMVDRCLQSLREPKVQLLAVDNGSASDVKKAIEGKGLVIRNNVNRYVNPAWNQMMQFFLKNPGKYDLLVIANSDLVMTPGWSAKLRAHRAAHPQEQIIFGTIGGQRSMGAFFAMTRLAVEACWPIPEDILIYGGDDFIFEVNRRVGFGETTAHGVKMSHVVSGTISKSPELWDLGKRDTHTWNHHVLPNLVPPRVEKFLRKKDRRP